MGSPACGLIRERIRQTDTLRLARGLVGYASSLAVLTGTDDLDAAVAASLPIVRRYLADRGTSFDRIVAGKRRQRKAKAS